MKYDLTLYVAGETARSARAITNLQRIVQEFLEGDCVMEVIDIIETPEAAMDEHIVATPTLIKNLPLPPRRVIGDLSDPESASFFLNPNRLNSKQQNPGGKS